MIKFKLEVKPVWVDGSVSDFNGTEIGDYSDKDRSKIKFQLRPLFPGRQRELRANNTHQIFADEIIDVVMKQQSKKVNLQNTPKNKKLIKEVLAQAGIGVREKFDQVGYNHDCIDECIQSWEGLLDEEDKPIPCTRENKTALFIDGGYSAIGIKIIDLSVMLAVRHDLYEMEKEKNSLSSQDGKQSEITK